MKTCTKCGEVKALDCFSVDKRRKSGPVSCCKTCRTVATKKYYEANKPASNACKAKWYQENKTRLLAKHSAKYLREKEAYVRRSTEWAKANPQKKREQVAIQTKRSVERLTANYVAVRIGIPVAKLTPELLELKREQLTIYRLAREIKNTLKLLKEKA